ncbi:hypothetical protein [Pseudomonas iridis]|uniref:hypothetical protein n=1 Tax=Pseudomonas iridis TaxID=2710587 RepID=UPI0021BE01DB|nr:hypothetical protein [Pseudomonas iridis]MCT8946732.1 hypothetical protein [Pseudomonas iridis]
MWEQIKLFLYKVTASLRSRTIFPDDLDIDTSDFFDKPIKLKIAVIDDSEFPWLNTLESKGHNVSIFSDYHKTNTKTSQRKLKAFELSKFDIVFCDIEGVGGKAFPRLEGVGVIQDIREQNPLQVIVAFTGSPARLLDPKTGENFTDLDSVFQRDWEVDDFLLNFNSLVKIFTTPKQRWKFLRARLVHLGWSESRITSVQRAFTENVLLLKYLGERSKISKDEIQRIVISSEKKVDIKGVVGTAAIAVKTINIASSLFIFNSFK